MQAGTGEGGATPGTVGEIVAWVRARVSGAAHLRVDSREVARGDVFVAVPGRRDNGRSHIEDALARGACAILVDGPPPNLAGAAPVLGVDRLASRLGEIGAAYYGAPTHALLTIGVTGTNGKTSCTHWIAQALSACRRRCAVIGTVGSGFPDALQADAGLTTPDAISLQRLARQWLDQGAQALAMEVSSIGLDQGRTDAMRFDLALFTNLTRDHLDYHGSMDHYERAKMRLFDAPSLAHAVLNLDDPAGGRILRQCRQRGLRVTGYRLAAAPGGAPAGAGALPEADAVDLELTAESVHLGADHLSFEACLQRRGEAPRRVPVRAPLIGRFNVSNVLGVLGIALAAGVEAHEAAQALGALRAPPGRLQPVDSGACAEQARQLPLVLVDYAHTPDAIEQALKALRPVAEARGGQLWIVFGAGGDRDPGKRPQMGEAAARGADRIVVTSDNPRTEDPDRIIEQIAAGAVRAGARFERIADRAAALQLAVSQASSADVVLIAGKGHEQYQETAAGRAPFSDVQCAAQALRRRIGQEQVS